MATGFKLDRYTSMGDVTRLVRGALARSFPWMVALLSIAEIYLFAERSSDLAIAFGLIAVSTAIAIAVWNGRAIGIPILPVLAAQHLLTYALPLFTDYMGTMRYSSPQVVKAGWEVAAFLLATTAAWRFGMTAMRPSSALSFVLIGIDREGVKGLTRLGMSLIAAATGFLVLQHSAYGGIIFDFLPNGSYSILSAVVSATSACGFFLMAMISGSPDTTQRTRIAFWSLLFVNGVLAASSFLLSASATTVFAVVVGFWWGTGRPPVRFALILIVVLSFFSAGKFTMRARYWEGDDDAPQMPQRGLLDIPSIYAEWSVASFEQIEAPAQSRSDEAPERLKASDSFLERINNLQNLLFVIDAVDRHYALLHGATYTLIPPLLIPRIIWPDKPRTHEGQILLNTHFGRQDLAATFETYIAWGLLPEAYGNFGPIAGAIVLGGALGLFAAWAENFTSRKPLLSAEGFVAFVVFMGFVNSFEMVASVMITSIFQAIIPVAAACAPFVHRKILTPPRETVT